jgi:hypothetical protein
MKSQSWTLHPFSARHLAIAVPHAPALKTPTVFMKGSLYTQSVWNWPALYRYKTKNGSSQKKNPVSVPIAKL